MNIESIEEFISKIWNDPVLASIIGGVILIILIGINKKIRNFISILFQRFRNKKKSKPKKSKNRNTSHSFKDFILNEVLEYNHFDFQLKKDEKYLLKNNIDKILWSHNNKKMHDIILIIDEMTGRITMNGIMNFYKSRRNSLINKFKTDFNRNARIILIVGYDKKSIKNDELNRFIKANKEFSKSLPIGDFRYYIISIDEHEKFKIERIFKVVDNEMF